MRILDEVSRSLNEYLLIPGLTGEDCTPANAGGMAVGRLTGRPVLRSGLRQLAFGALAFAVTYLVGHLIGSSHA